MIERIHEHSVELTLLGRGANVLDVGCRGFAFGDHFKRIGHKVYSVDVDEFEGDYYRLAIGGYDGYTGIFINKNDPQATRIKEGNEIEMLTIKSFSERVGVDFWDLIKIDIEGSEFEVIMSLTEPPARQLSIEFHLHTGIYGELEMRQMEKKLTQWYIPVKHEKTNEHCAGANFWDSLFILK